MKSIGKIIDLIFAVVKYFIAMLFGWLVILVFLQVFNRFLLNSALAWSEEIANYTMMWIALLGASMLMRNRGHMAVNNLLDASKGTVKTMMTAISVVLQAIFLCSWIYGCVVFLPTVKGMRSPAKRTSPPAERGPSARGARSPGTTVRPRPAPFPTSLSP